MTLAGMDVAEVRQLAGELRRAADQLHSLVSTLDGRVSSTGWTGRDADTFKHQWWPQHRQAVLHAAETIQGLGQSASNNADEQERASSPNGGSAAVWAAGAGAAVAGAAGVAGNHGATTTPAPNPTPAPTHAGPSGTQNYSAQRSIDLARNEVGTSRPTGYDQPGECVKSVQRWIQEAGGKFGGGGVVSGYENSGAISVPVADVRAGDVLQFTSTTHPDSWDAGPVHTVLVAGVNSDGTYDIIQSNSPFGSGRVSEIQKWTPAHSANMEWRGWRFAANP